MFLVLYGFCTPAKPSAAVAGATPLVEIWRKANIFDERQVQLVELEEWELPDPNNPGEEIEVMVPSPFISTYRMWGLEARFSF